MPSRLKKFIHGDDLSEVIKKDPAPRDAGTSAGTESAGTQAAGAESAGAQSAGAQSANTGSAGAGPAGSDNFEKNSVPVYSAPLEQGLTASQVEERTANGYANINTVSATKTVRQIFHDNIFTYFNLVFAILAIILLMVQAYSNMFFLVIVVSNALIGIIQELRSKRSVDKLTILAEEKVLVLRDGNWEAVPSSHLVRDDIVKFKNGDQICADALVRAGECSVNESLLTGESDAIKKKCGDAMKSGSTCSAGSCIAQLTHVGSESYAARLTVEAKSNMSVGKSDMMLSLDKLIKAIGIAIIPVGIALFLRERFSVALTMRESVRYTVAAVIGMIPEGLYLLTSVALALSVVRLARKKVLVRDMSCVETLARVDTLCVDKTGTITEPGMDVQELVPLAPEQFPEEELRQMLFAFYRAMPVDNDTAAAMEKAFGKGSGTTGWKPAKIIPFASETKWSAVTFRENGSFLIGAPEFILKDRMDEVRSAVAPYANQGMRVLLIAHTDKPVVNEDDELVLDRASLQSAALVCITNRIRKDADKTFQYFAKQGVTVKVISGDSPLTVSQVARQACIENADSYVDATTLQTPEDITEAAGKYTVFGRVTPQQKLALVKALKAQGHTVAMTGDGVNDVLALKEANCGIAMASGSQAASQISKLVLLNSDFRSMPSIVDEGRQVINNIQRSASLFLVKNIFSFVFAIITIIAGFSYPMQPNQLSMISSLTIGMPAFFLALQMNHSRITGRFLPNVIYRALPGALTDIILILGIEAFANVFHLGVSSLSTTSALVMLVVGVLVLYMDARPLDSYRKRVLIFDIICILCAVIIVPRTRFAWLIELGTLDVKSALIFVVFAALAYPLLLVMTKFVAACARFYQKMKRKRSSKKAPDAAA